MDKYITKVPRKVPINKTEKSHKNYIYLSGAISAYMSEGQDVKYMFFGDSHYSVENMCKGNCSYDFENEREFEERNSDMNINCWEVALLFNDIINKAKREGKFVDVYIEIPYLGKGVVPNKEYIFQQVSKGGYLMKLFGVFYECITKSPKCKYNNVRFHFTDIRQEFIEEDGKYDDSLLVYETFVTLDLYEKMMFNFNTLYEIINNKNDEKSEKIKSIQKYIILMDKLLSRLYDINDPLASKLFRLYLESDNFEIDMYKELMDDLKLIEMYDKVLMKQIVKSMIPQHLIVKRRNKVMHKIRAQFESLGNENIKASNKIKKYIEKEYLKESNFEEVRKAWKEIMLIFIGLISNKKGKITKDEITSGLKRLDKRLTTIIEKGVTGTSLLMDAYTLARMMRTFPDSKESSYKIIFAGQEHVKRYVNYFEKHMNETFDKYEPQYKEDELNRCFKINSPL